MPIDVNFRQIRAYDGSQDRSFEELCFQLIPVIDALPEGTRLIRHGTPDGGVEALAALPDGNVWAWQAKYLFALGAGEFAQLDKSVESALRSQPTLKRYVFFLPYNRPAGRVAGRKSAMERWNEHRTKWQAWATGKGMSVEFDYFGESEILNVLTLPGQSGRAMFWFNVAILTQDWFELHATRAVEVAGRRYTPELNVDLPIAKLFEGLGRTKEFQTSLGLTLRAIRNSRRWSSIDDLSRKTPQYIQEVNLAKCREALDDLDAAILNVRIPSDTLIDFDGIARKCGVVTEILQKLSDDLYTHARDAERSEQREGDASSLIGRKLQVTLESGAYELRRTANEIDELRELTLSEAAQLVNVPTLLVVGDAGKGKTHLLCDVTTRRVQAGWPTVMLFGQHFVEGEPWNQILKQLDLNCSVDEFLGALHAAAEVCDARALILIDAINEGYGVDVWPAHMTAFLNKLKKWPRVGIAISCRTSYVDMIIPEELDDTKLIRVEHEGFAGNEYIAVRKFFGHYHLTLPDFPLLVPEFRTPLFLKIMCEGLVEKGMSTLPRGSSGVSSLFNLFLEAVETRLYRPTKCNYAQADRLVYKAVVGLAESMVVSDCEWVSWQTAKDLTERLLPNREWTNSLLQGLLSEGILMQSSAPGTDGRQHQEAVFFVYQRMGDYLRASAICERHQNVGTLQTVIRSIVSDRTSAYRHSGLIAALSVLLPEKYGGEFYELVTDSSLEPVQQGYLESLVWRTVESFPNPFPVDYLNSVARSSGWTNRLVFETILQVASVPNHPLNALRLHSTLWRLSMANRDTWWTRFLHENYGNESQIDRMVEWAWSSDTTFSADDTALLCAIALAWFLTSSNRRLRDHSTKGLVSLLWNRPSVLRELLTKFHGVNDPYVAERLYAVAYGCALVTADNAAIAELAEAVYNLIFREGKPPVHILLRDYARGVIERAAVMGCLPAEIDLQKARPPYVSPWPITARTEVELRKRYLDVSQDYFRIWSSLSSLGDFHRYIVEPAASKFTAPNQRIRQQEARREERRRVEERSVQAQENWKQLIETLDKSQKTLMVNYFRGKSKGKRFLESLNDKQRELLRTSIVPPSNNAATSNHPVPFSTDIACRWIFTRVAGLGWTPKKFGNADRMVEFDRGRPAQQERIGKKYQWIAFYELLARLADHQPLMPDWGQKEQRQYDGPWQVLISRSDIDPSLLLRSSERVVWDSIPRCWWAPALPTFPVPSTPISRLTWLEISDDLPSPLELIKVSDGNGNIWLTLEGHYNWEETTPPEEERYQIERCNTWYQFRSYLIHNEDVDNFLNWSAQRNWMGRWMPESYDFYDVLLGEHPWHPAANDQRRIWEQPNEYHRSIPVPMLVTTANYHREAGRDQSIDDHCSGILPSSYLLERMGLGWSGQNFRYEHNHEVVAWDPSAEEPGPPALLINPEKLNKLLSDEGLMAVWTILGEKNLYGPSLSHGEYKGHLEVFGSVILDDGEPKLNSLTCEFHSPKERLGG